MQKHEPLAKASLVQGLYVFINSSPIVDYETIATEDVPVFQNIFDAAKGKNFGEALKDVFKETTEHTNFHDLLSKVLEKI